MAEYIDREAAINAVFEAFADGRSAYIALETVPADDVAPVVRGRWEYDHWCEFRCSECGEWSKSEPYRGKERYCPNCGARMCNEEEQT